MAGKLKNIFYVALTRRSDATVLAQFGRPDSESDVAKLIASPAFFQKTQPGKRTSLTNKGSVFHMLSNPDGLVVVVVTASDYPQRVVYGSFCEDIFGRFIEAYKTSWSTAAAKKFKKFESDLKSLCEEYDNPSSKNKIANLKAQVEQTKGVMQDNISKALKNVETTEQLEEKAEDLVTSADKFKKGAGKLAWREWCMLMKMRVMIVLVLVVILIIVIVMVCDGQCGGADSGASAAGVTSTPSAQVNAAPTPASN
mgnify:CR=1 FL=1